MNDKFKANMAFLQSQHAANRHTLNFLHLNMMNNPYLDEVTSYKHEIAKYVKLQKHIKTQIKYLGLVESLNKFGKKQPMKTKLDNGQVLEVFEEAGITYARIDDSTKFIVETNSVPILIRTLPANRVIVQSQRDNKIYERELIIIGTTITSLKSKEIHGN